MRQGRTVTWKRAGCRGQRLQDLQSTSSASFTLVSDGLRAMIVLLQVRTVKWMSGQSRVPASAPAASAAGVLGQGQGEHLDAGPSARTTGFAPTYSARLPTGSLQGNAGQHRPCRQGAFLATLPAYHAATLATLCVLELRSLATLVVRDKRCSVCRSCSLLMMKCRCRSCLKRPDGGSASEERRLSFASGSAQSAQSTQQPPTPPALYAMHPMGRSVQALSGNMYSTV